MWIEWFPWKFIVRRVAQAHGFLDPIAVLARLHRFAQPAEVVAPTELLRSGAVFHARGLMNSQAIQHNLDWIWPHWVVRQFDPRDEAFVPRAFSLTHINLTHRNWTAVGLPNIPDYPLVDPRGLLTPLFDGWSLDSWILTGTRQELLPSRLPAVTQRLELDGTLAVVTDAAAPGGLSLRSRVELLPGSPHPVCRLRVTGRAAQAPAWLVISLRPYNPEGVSFIHAIAPLPDGPGWQVNRHARVRFDAVPDRLGYSHYRLGDVYRRLPDVADTQGVSCDVGMATAAALFALQPAQAREVVVSVPLDPPRLTPGNALRPAAVAGTWPESLRGHCALRLPDARLQFLYDAAIRTLILHAPGEVFPGPYTYRRFWFRDAAFIVHALACAGLAERARRALDGFPARQNSFGYFLSQQGEWDSNGQVLWIMRRFCELTGEPPPEAWRKPIQYGGRWIQRKRLSEQLEAPHAGLLPAGFSAEHLGPNDYYYWDDFWGVAGLQAAAALMETYGEHRWSRDFFDEAERFAACIARSLAGAARRLGRPAMPASPYRRLDAGAIGSLAAGYPLHAWAADDPRLLDTAAFLLERCFVDGGFFQAVTHSGINPYLTLHVAQVLLRADDARWLELVQAIAGMASATGQWPEAVHPKTRGGCMGDGQHVWASAEWVLMMRHCFIREEAGRLILGAGLAPSWYGQRGTLSFGPAPSAFGPVTVSVQAQPEMLTVEWEAAWRGQAPPLEIRLPGYAPVVPGPGEHRVSLPREGGP